ncbi:MAG: CHASE sensor domain-containing protein, partial [Methylobacter sp.]
MTRFIRNLPINRKLLLILTFSSITSLLFAGLLLIVLEITEFQKNTQDDLSTLARMVGNRSTAALMFGDKDLANENLAVFGNVPDVQLACLYDGQGIVFAQLQKQNASECPLSIKSELTRFEKDHLHITESINVDGAELGTVYIYADLTRAYWRRIQFSGLILLVLAGVSILSFFLSTPLLKLISSPIKKLVDKVKKISDTK